MDQAENPYRPPGNSDSERNDTSGPSLRPWLWAQVIAATVCVVLGQSEINPSLRWAVRFLFVVPPASLIAAGTPLALIAICVRRGMLSIMTISILMVSITLALVAFRGLLPLVQ